MTGKTKRQVNTETPSLKCARVGHAVRGVLGKRRFGRISREYLTGVLTYLTEFLVESVASEAVEQQDKTIKMQHVAKATANDFQFSGSLKNYNFIGKGCAVVSDSDRDTFLPRLIRHQKRVEIYNKEVDALKTYFKNKALGLTDTKPK